MASTTRHFGLPGLELSHGEHICVLHTGKRQRDAILVPFLREGLQAGEKCIVVLDEHDASALHRAVFDDAATAESTTAVALDLKTLSDQADRSSGEFSPDELVEFWDAQLAPGFERDEYQFARFGGEAAWWLTQLTTDEIVLYESHLNRFTDRRPQALLCMYDTERFGDEMIVAMIRTHPRVLVHGTLIDNPHYLTPDEYLALRRGEYSPGATDDEIIEWYRDAEREALGPAQTWPTRLVGTGDPTAGSPSERLSIVVNQATGIVAVQADCGVIDAFEMLQARAVLLGQTLEHTALDVIDHIVRFDV